VAFREKSRKQKCWHGRPPPRPPPGFGLIPARLLAGNAIDFFVQVLGLSFHDAMRQITDS